MSRRFLIVLFSLGTLAGYGSAFRSATSCHRGRMSWHEARQQAQEQRMAEACTNAYRRAQLQDSTRLTPKEPAELR